MPSLSVHQRKVQLKVKRDKQRKPQRSRTPPLHPDVVAAAEWLAAFTAPGPPLSSPSSPPPSVLSPSLLDASAVSALRRSFSSALPFPHVVVPSFLHPLFAHHLLSEVRHCVEYSERCTDLYEFHQSSDLKAATSPLLVRLREELYGERFRKWMGEVSGGVELSGLSHSVSMSCAVYADTHHLLCHDDRLQGRRVAYILYLVPEDWEERDGGQLDLFACDGARQLQTQQHRPHQPHPQQPRSSRASTTSLLPRWNSFVAFQVSPSSFHAVREVTTRPTAQPPRVRVSISGWFHAPQQTDTSTTTTTAHLTAAQQPVMTLPPIQLPALPASASPSSSSSSSLSLSYWLSPTYCAGGGGVRAIRRRFESDSSIELRHLLLPTRYAQLLTALHAVQRKEPQDDDCDDGEEERKGEEEDERLRCWRWRWAGPLNHSHYQRCRWPFTASPSDDGHRRQLLDGKAAAENGAEDGGDDPVRPVSLLSPLDAFSRFVRSTEFAAWLCQVTGLSLCSVGGEWRRFSGGSYTLAHDEDEERRMEACDVNFCFLDTPPSTSSSPSTPSSSSPSGAGAKKARGRPERSTSTSAAWDSSWGGGVHYIAAGEEEELLNLPPTANTLTLVYRAGSSEAAAEISHDSEGSEAAAAEGAEEDERGGSVMRFVQYVNHHAPTPRIDCDMVWRVAPT